MDAFTYEEQGGRRYLSYEKRAGDDIDFLTLEMISNNTIEGAASSSYIQIDDKFFIKYDITGLLPLCDYLKGTVSREQLLNVLGAVADAAIEAEDYMLDISSYVLKEDYVYIDPSTMKVFMIVLPVLRQDNSLETFLKELLMDVQYDQSEDCSYVAALLNLFSRSGTFALPAFKAQVIQFKKEKAQVKVHPEPDFRPDPRAGRQEEPSRPKNEPSKSLTLSKEEREKIVHELKRQHDLDVLFSEEEIFPKKEKKKHFWERFLPRGKKTPEDIADEKPAMGGIAIPGMETLSEPLEKMDWPGKEKNAQNAGILVQDVAIPAQNVQIERRNIEKQDFGETEFIGQEDEEETQFIGMEPALERPEFVLRRLSTGETFRICDEITRIGRSASVSEICIAGNKGVGRVHALLYIREGQVFIEDNNSKNKTYVEGVQLKPGEPPRRLEHGAKIRLGDEELEFGAYVGHTDKHM